MRKELTRVACEVVAKSVHFGSQNVRSNAKKEAFARLQACKPAMALADSLALKRMHKQLQHTLPRDAKLAVASDEVFNAIRGGINALGDDALRQAAAIFAKHDLNGDGSLSARELMHMKTDLRSVLPAGAPALPMPARPIGHDDFCKRVAQSRQVTQRGRRCVVRSGSCGGDRFDARPRSREWHARVAGVP